MSKIFAALALLGALLLTGLTTAAAQEKAAGPAAAAATASAAAPAAAPVATPAPTPNKGDVSWMLISTALVLMMSVPALALFYGGMVRSKNML